jgi:hypothetical protein
MLNNTVYEVDGNDVSIIATAIFIIPFVNRYDN